MKSLIFKTLFGALIVIGSLSLVLWLWGDRQPIQTEIRKVPTFSRYEPLAGLSPAAFSDENLTEKVSQQLADEVIEQNPEGPVSLQNGFTGIVPLDVDAFVSQSITNAAKAFDVAALVPKLTRADLNVTPASDAEAIKSFFQEAITIANTHFDGVEINLQEPEKTNFPKLLGAYEGVIRDYLKLPVPSAVVDLHLRQIILIGANKNALTLISNYQTDPLQATLALQAGEKFASDLIALTLEINRFLTARHINLAS